MGFSIKKALGAVAPLAGAAIGFATGGPAGAALGLGLGGAAGGLVAGQPSQPGGGLAGIDPAAYQPLTPDQLNQYLGLLYPAPPATGTPVPEMGTPAPAPPAVTAPPAMDEATRRAIPGFVNNLYTGVLNRAPDPAGQAYWEQRAREGMPLEQIVQSFQNAAQSGTDPLAPPPGGYKGYGTWGPNGEPLWDPNAPPPNGGFSGLGGGPSISGGTPAFNIAGGALSKTNTFVQNEFARRFPEQLAALDELRAQVAPNVSLARQAALGQVRDQARQAQGNLRQQISRRGLAGSSFAQSAEGQLSAEYAKQAAQVEVQAAQQELDLTAKFIDMQRGLMAEALARDLTELQVGADLAIAGGRLAADIANIQATLAAAELQARTQLNVANIAAEASRFASTSGLISQGIASSASMTNAELAARGGIIQAGLGANTSALGFQTQAAIANREIASQEAAGRASLFGNLAGLGLGTFFNSRNNTGQFINSGASTSGFPNLNFGLGFG